MRSACRFSFLMPMETPGKPDGKVDSNHFIQTISACMLPVTVSAECIFGVVQQRSEIIMPWG